MDERRDNPSPPLESSKERDGHIESIKAADEVISSTTRALHEMQSRLQRISRRYEERARGPR